MWGATHKIDARSEGFSALSCPMAAGAGSGSRRRASTDRLIARWTERSLMALRTMCRGWWRAPGGGQSEGPLPRLEQPGGTAPPLARNARGDGTIDLLRDVRNRAPGSVSRPHAAPGQGPRAADRDRPGERRRLPLRGPTELKAGLRRLAGDRKLRRRMAEAGHRALKERWMESEVTEQWLDLIARVARRRGLEGVAEALGREPD